MLAQGIAITEIMKYEEKLTFTFKNQRKRLKKKKEIMKKRKTFHF